MKTYPETKSLSPQKWHHVMELGLCVQCDQPKVTARMCRAHADAMCDAVRRSANKIIAKGLCVLCKTPRGKTGTKRHCRSCADKRTITQIESDRRRSYGVEPERLNEMLRAQGNKCAICLENLAGKYGFHVDHNHKTGAIRDLLCGKCNRGLGHFKDNPLLLREAANYLDNHTCA